MTDILRVIGGFELFILTLGFWTFTLLFHVLADWRASAMGKHFMSLMASCSLVLAWMWAGFMLSLPDAIRGWGRVVLYGALGFIVWRQVRILVRMQTIARDNSEKSDTTMRMEKYPHGGDTVT